MSGDRARRLAKLAGARIYLIWTPETAAGDPIRAAERALATGLVDLFQLRMQTGTPANRRSAGLRLRRACDRHAALFLVNDDLALARALDADGIHVGQQDATPAEARRRLGDEVLVGQSTHDEAEVRAARDLAVDYLGLGPCYETTSKKLTRAAGGPALVRGALPAAGRLPVFPIGGITPGRIPELVEAGARAVAIGAAVLAAPDPARAAEAIHAALAPVR